MMTEVFVVLGSKRQASALTTQSQVFWFGVGGKLVDANWFVPSSAGQVGKVVEPVAVGEFGAETWLYWAFRRS